MDQKITLNLQKIAIGLLSAAILILLWIFLPSLPGVGVLQYVLGGLATLLILLYAGFFFLRKQTEKSRTTRAICLLTAALAILIYYNFFS